MSIALEVLQADNTQCIMCPLRKQGYDAVCGHGTASAKLMVLGQWPGADEELLGRPFEDRGGLMLKKLMAAAKIEPEQTYLNYMVRCRPKKSGPTPASVRACRTWLWQELQIVNPKVIVTLGRPPTGLLLKLKKTFKLEDVAGQFHTLNYLPGTLVAPWHGVSRLFQQGRQGDLETVRFFETVKERL